MLFQNVPHKLRDKQIPPDLVTEKIDEIPIEISKMSIIKNQRNKKSIVIKSKKQRKTNH